MIHQSQVDGKPPYIEPNRACDDVYYKESHTVGCKEGITQGCCLSMVCYGIALMPLAEWLRRKVPGALQPWCADDLSGIGIGTASDNANILQLLKEKWPYVGYYPEPDKSHYHYVCMPQDEEAAKAAFEAADIPDLNYGRSRRYLGGVYGDAAD